MIVETKKRKKWRKWLVKVYLKGSSKTLNEELIERGLAKKVRKMKVKKLKIGIGIEIIALFLIPLNTFYGSVSRANNFKPPLPSSVGGNWTVAFNTTG